MPTSNVKQLSTIINLIMVINPQKLLDIGVGFGKYGFLSREYLEYYNNNNDYKKWSREIDGIEIFEDYLTAVHKFIYNNIYIGNAADLLAKIEKEYDLILLIDVLEHFSYAQGLDVLNNCKRISKNIIISIPKDIGEQGECFNNPNEKHEFQWRDSHLSTFKRFTIPNHESFICCISDEAEKFEKLLKKDRLNDFKINFKNSVKINFPFLHKLYKKIK